MPLAHRRILSGTATARRKAEGHGSRLELLVRCSVQCSRVSFPKGTAKRRVHLSIDPACFFRDRDDVWVTPIGWDVQENLQLPKAQQTQLRTIRHLLFTIFDLKHWRAVLGTLPRRPGTTAYCRTWILFKHFTVSPNPGSPRLYTGRFPASRVLGSVISLWSNLSGAFPRS